MCLLLTLPSTFTHTQKVFYALWFTCLSMASIFLEPVIIHSILIWVITFSETLYIRIDHQLQAEVHWHVDKLFCSFLCKIIVHMIYWTSGEFVISGPLKICYYVKLQKLSIMDWCFHSINPCLLYMPIIRINDKLYHMN